MSRVSWFHRFRGVKGMIVSWFHRRFRGFMVSWFHRIRGVNGLSRMLNSHGQ